MIKALSLLAALGLGPDATTPPVIPVEFPVTAETVVAYPTQTELRQRSSPRLSDSAQEAWDNEFVTATYFSAFAYARSGGYGYATLSNTPQAARDVALQQCLSLNESCKIIAEIVPEGYRQLEPGVIGLTPLILGFYEDSLAAGRFRAMAISADGAYAAKWNSPSQAEADADALGSCESYRNRAFPDLQEYPCVLLPGLD